MDLSIVIPAYNESAKIGVDLHAAARFLEESHLQGEILVVDDGSRDDTIAQAERFCSEIPGARVLSYGTNRGKGYALRHGMTQAQAPYVMFADAGLCVPYQLALIPLAMLRQDMCDVAIASRRLRGSIRQHQPLYRKVGSKVYSWVVKSWMGIPWHLTDTQCGFKMYRREVAHQLFGAALTDGFMIDVEILLRAGAAGYRVLEFPVVWKNDADTRYHPIKGTIRNFRELLAIRRGLKGERSNA